MTVARRNDPFLSARFVVEIEGIVVGGFSEVTGLQAEIDTEEYQEGGVNTHVHLLPKGAKYSKLVLKRGMTESDRLARWLMGAVNGKIERKTVHIMLLDSEGNRQWAWRCTGAYPVRWSGPEMRADQSSVAVESLELAHTGIQKV